MMSLISSGIDKLRTFELPCGVWADGNYVGIPRTVLVKWRSGWSDKFYQVYANGKYAGTTTNSQQRQMIVQVPTSLESPVRIEVFAVEPADIYTDFSNEIDPPIDQRGRVKIGILRSQDLPVRSKIHIYCDNGTGQIDYENPFNSLPVRVWPSWQDKAGFGMSRFGSSDLGYDSSAAVGFGIGGFCRNWFGIDVDTIEWISSELEAGVYKFAIKIVDEAGNESGSSEVEEVTVIPTAKPAEELGISSFDKQTNQLVLSVA